MPQLLRWLVALAAATPASFEARVDAVQAVERARYAFTLDAAVPFEHFHTRDVFIRRVGREIREELLLARLFDTRVSAAMLAAEFERIERQTQDPEQWRAAKRALGDDRRVIEHAVCRPLVVHRLLRHYFAFDESIHAEAHAKARHARRLFLEGRPVAGGQVLRLARASGTRTDRAWLAEAKVQANGPLVLAAPADVPESPAPARLVRLHQEAVRVLEAQLEQAGDVSTVLSDHGRFAVYRLIDTNTEAWTVQAAIFPKRDFESWFREATATYLPGHGHDFGDTVIQPAGRGL